MTSGDLVAQFASDVNAQLEPQQFKSAPFQQATVSMISSVPELCRQYLDSHGWHLDMFPA